jgi:putative ABC transport system permease protein
MMATGAASASAALAGRLDDEFPFDVEARAMDDVGMPGELPTALVGEFAATEGVADVAVLSAASVTLTSTGGSQLGVDAVGMDTAEGLRVLRADDQVAGLDDTTVIVPVEVANWTGIVDGDTLLAEPVDIWPADGGKPVAGVGTPTELTAEVTDLPGTTVVVTKTTLATISAAAQDATMWVRLTDGADPGDAVADLESAASQSSGASVAVVGAASERAAYQEVIDTMLAIVIGLLAVSVAIALVGVANTLSLSVIERRRESATLRAIGLSRRQLRASLAAEGMIIAGVGALAGAVIGTLYGWVGARTVLESVGPTPFVVAWREVAMVVGIAVAAGFAASVLPARRAVRTSPVEALAVE